VRVRRRLAPSLRALAAHRLRVALALASVAIGVAALLLTSGIGGGARAEVLRGIDAMGTTLVIVRPAPVKRLAARRTVRGVVTSLELEDYDAILGLGAVAGAAPGAEAMVRVKDPRGALLRGRRRPKGSARRRARRTGRSVPFPG
jgi:putative ABC transport system permease protein